MCREIESTCKGSGWEFVFREREREGECTEREREREGGRVHIERERDGTCAQTEGRSVF